MIDILHLSVVAWSLVGVIIISIAVFGIFLLGYLTGKRDGSVSDKYSKKITRATLGGQFSEQVAPFLPNFPPDLKASEARFIGKPIDFIIFNGMDEQNINEVVFVEVKSGKSQLTTNERKLRDAINEKRVSWYEYRVPEDVSNMQEKTETLAN